MDGSGFDEANCTLAPPPGMSEADCYSLRVWRGERRFEGVGSVPVVISCFKVSAEELAEIQRTGRVWLTVLGVTMPPVLLEGVKPIGPVG